MAIAFEVHRSEINAGVVVRKDRGIKSAKDLTGKKIAAIPKTNAEFLLDLYLRSRTPVIALTVYALIEEIESCLRVGCDMHLAKPVCKRALLDALASGRSARHDTCLRRSLTEQDWNSSIDSDLQASDPNAVLRGAQKSGRAGRDL